MQQRSAVALAVTIAILRNLLHISRISTKSNFKHRKEWESLYGVLSALLKLISIQIGRYPGMTFKKSCKVSRIIKAQ